MTTTEEHIAALREALEAGPMPGPWIQGGLSTRDPHWMRDVRTTDGGNVAWIGGGEPYKAHAVAAYIAAANPEAIRAVLAALDEANAALREAECALSLMQSYGHCQGDREYGPDAAQVRAMGALKLVSDALTTTGA